MWWSTSSGLIELNITKSQALKAAHQGACDDSVMELSKHPKIASQLNKLLPHIVKDELAEYGAWNDLELSNHSQNLQRLLWLACGDINEGR